MNSKELSLTLIIRASGEATVGNLKTQLNKQKSKKDKLFLLDDEVSFEEKLKQGYELAMKIGNEFTVFIDGDILLRSNAIKRIKKLCRKLNDHDFGFGLKLWDRFYNQPKFRGLHVYRTKLLKRAITHIPLNKKELRPESFVKGIMKTEGNKWRNDLSFYIAGIHDFYQRPEDIYYKFLIRSKRSESDIKKLESIFKSEPSNCDYKIALEGLKDGSVMDDVVNNKFLYNKKNTDAPSFSVKNHDSLRVDFVIYTKLIKYYKFNSFFWKSI